LVSTLLIDGNTLTLEQVEQVARGSVEVRLSEAALEKISKSRDVIDTVLASNKTVYGVNTGFGALSNKRISAEQLEQLQVNLVRSHAVGTGPMLEAPIVRARCCCAPILWPKGFPVCMWK